MSNSHFCNACYQINGPSTKTFCYLGVEVHVGHSQVPVGGIVLPEALAVLYLQPVAATLVVLPEEVVVVVVGVDAHVRRGNGVGGGDRGDGGNDSKNNLKKKSTSS